MYRPQPYRRREKLLPFTVQKMTWATFPAAGLASILVQTLALKQEILY